MSHEEDMIVLSSIVANRKSKTGTGADRHHKFFFQGTRFEHTFETKKL